MEPEPEKTTPSKAKKVVKTEEKEKKEKSVESKGSAGSKGSKGSVGSQGAKKVVSKAPVATKTTASKVVAPKPAIQKAPPVPTNVQVAQMQAPQLTNAQVAQTQSPSFQIPQQQMLNSRGPMPRQMPMPYRQQRAPQAAIVQPAVFNDDEPPVPEVAKEKAK
jgi:hypothetical protein